MKKILFFVALFLVLLVGHSIALTASSSSYSFSMFGNGIATGRGDSNNYNSTFLSETGGTTRNAESSSFRANIGLSVTALNAQSVWVQITSPDSQVQILNLMNGQILNYLPVPSIVGRYG